MMSVQSFVQIGPAAKEARGYIPNDYSEMRYFVMNNPQHCFGLKLALNLSNLRLYFAYPKLSCC